MHRPLLHTACRPGLLAATLLSALALISCGGSDDRAENRPIPANRLDQTPADTAPADAASRMQPLAAAAADPGRTVYPSDLLDWAESQYPQLFPTHEANRHVAPYTYRYYPATGNFAGQAGDQIFVLGPVSGGQLQNVGSAKSVYCLVYAQECGQAPVSVDSEAQTRQLAARTANAVFIYDALSFEIINGVFKALWGGIGSALTQSPLSVGRKTLPCQSGGSAQATIVDSDGSRTLTVGDSIRVSASGCVLDDGTGPTFSGELEISIAEGDNMARFWNDGARGLIELRLDYRGVRTRFGLIEGSYRFRSDWPQGQEGGDDSSNFDSLLATGNDNTRIRLSDVQLHFGPSTEDNSSTLLAASGAVTTEVAGLGTLRSELSVLSALQVSTKTLRYRPQNGALRLSGKGFRIDMSYSGNRAVGIALDNGSDGSLERRLSTTEDQLDTLVRDF